MLSSAIAFGSTGPTDVEPKNRLRTVTSGVVAIGLISTTRRSAPPIATDVHRVPREPTDLPASPWRIQSSRGPSRARGIASDTGRAGGGTWRPPVPPAEA